MLSKQQNDDAVELKEFDESNTDVIVDDYKDLELEIMDSSHAKTLWWMKHYD